MKDDRFDVAVVGGGLVGAAIAWGLGRAGQRVIVLDESDLAVRASRGNFALVWVQGKGMGLTPYSHWTLASSRAWPTLADDLKAQTGLDVCLQQPGGFHICLSEDEFTRRADFVERFRSQPGVAPYRIGMLDRAALAGLLPEIGPQVVGASYCEHDGHVNSLRLFRAFHAGLMQFGAVYRASFPVAGIALEAGGFRITAAPALAGAGAGKGAQDGSRVAMGEGAGAGMAVRAERIVLAAGNANARLAPLVGLNAPMRPERGQIIVTERVRPFLKHPLSTIRQSDEGTVMIGDSKEEGTTAHDMNRPINSMMANRAVRTFPLLASLNVVRSWRAIRVMPADGFPIYEESLTHPGAFLATCHSGVTLAAAHALQLAPMIARGRLDAAQTDAFSSRRFDVQAH